MKRRKNSGQAVLEYVLLMVMIVGFGSLILAFLPRLFAKMEEPITKTFKHTYQYGFADACGFDDTEAPCTGTPQKHIRYDVGGSFRLFGRGQ